MISAEQKKKPVVIYGITDRSKEPLLVRINDFLIDHSWIKTNEKSLFFQSLQLLVASGVRLSRALEILAEKNKNPRLKRILHTIHYDLNNAGFSFSNAMAKYPDVFSNSETKMILSGEISGRLEEVLGHITTQIQKNLKLKTQIRSAMIYPATIFTGIFLAIIVIMIWVVPQFKDLFGSFGAELPLSTRLLIQGSEFFQAYWWIVISTVIAALLLFQNWKKSPEGKYAWDKMVLDFPIIKRLVRNFQTIQIASNFSTLLSAGISVVKALQVLRQIIDNAVTKEALHEVEKSVRAGDMLHEGFAKNKIFDPVISEIIEIGERSGSIDTILNKTGQQYEMEFDADMQNFAKLIEPIVLIVVAGAIVFMGMAIMTPILQMQSLFSSQ